MNKTDLVNEVASKAGMTKKDAEQVINAFFAYRLLWLPH
ncbi:MAG TPA: hypothetical protein GXX58_01360 [Gelria sp.]|nr:hypothetical protein [Gelria sp.]